jgi:hypothetical protein
MSYDFGAFANFTFLYCVASFFENPAHALSIVTTKFITHGLGNIPSYKLSILLILVKYI